jgi:enoyl-CoA hydratase
MLVQTADHAGGVRVLRLDRPPANAINVELLAALASAVSACDQDASVRAVVLTGTGRFFSAGLDLKEMAAKGPGELADLGGGRDGLYRLWRLGKPTIAMVNGHAIAGGAILALACDFRIAARGAFKIGLTETALGLPFPNGAYQITRAALSDAQARLAMLEADTFDPPQAREVGFLDEVVEVDELEVRCLERARKLGAFPTSAYAHTKNALQAPADHLIHHASGGASDAFARAVASPETRELLFGGGKR